MGNSLEDVRCHYMAGGYAWFTNVAYDTDSVMYMTFDEFLKDYPSFLKEGWEVTLSHIFHDDFDVDEEF